MIAFSFKKPKQPKETTNPKRTYNSKKPYNNYQRENPQTLDYDTSLNEVMFRKRYWLSLLFHFLAILHPGSDVGVLL